MIKSNYADVNFGIYYLKNNMAGDWIID